ncbi:MAG: hypothetical protein JST54_05970 [Deltaproteobacteria bacterium]|nr:hypothetical protein [Deltaproteobacteria bacterium]
MSECDRPKPLRLDVARPCPVSWDTMAGDDKVRFCALCQKCVYNLSAMKLAEARQLVEEREGKICVRFFQRDDGTVMTEDCAFGIERVRRSVRRGVGATLGFIAAMFGLASPGIFGEELRRVFGATATTGALVNTLDPPKKPKHHHMGVIGFASYSTMS